jgi:predicted DNA binding CopG/RHH family protein
LKRGMRQSCMNINHLITPLDILSLGTMLIVWPINRTKYSVVILAALFLFGCKTGINNFNQHLKNLQASASSTSELQSATALSNYATDEHLSYTLEIKDLETSSPIRMDELEQVMSKKLSVTISVSESDFEAIWKPVDNSNIFILLRE